MVVQVSGLNVGAVMNVYMSIDPNVRCVGWVCGCMCVCVIWRVICFLRITPLPPYHTSPIFFLCVCISTRRQHRPPLPTGRTPYQAHALSPRATMALFLPAPTQHGHPGPFRLDLSLSSPPGRLAWGRVCTWGSEHARPYLFPLAAVRRHFSVSGETCYSGGWMGLRMTDRRRYV
jgi:hypothetical protein